MIIALRANITPLARRVFDLLPFVYMLLGLTACVSVAIAVLQDFDYFFWETHEGRPTGLFFSPIVQGGFLGLVIVAMAMIRWWEVIPICVLGIGFAENRGGLVVAVVGLLAVLVRKPLVILAVILLGALYQTSHPAFSDLERFNIWEAGWVNLTWFGNGWGSYAEVWIIRDGLGFQPLHAHNDYLELVFEFGLYSVPLFCLLAYALSQTSLPEWPILVAFCTMATFAMPTYIPATAGIGAIALASCLRGNHV